MAGKSGAGRGLILGLIVAALGLTALAQGSQAGRAREAQESSMAVVKQQRPLQRLARADDVTLGEQYAA